MKNGKHPNPETLHPIAGYDKEIYVKPAVKNPNILVGEFTYIADTDFESHVTHLYPWNGFLRESGFPACFLCYPGGFRAENVRLDKFFLYKFRFRRYNIQGLRPARYSGPSQRNRTQKET